MRRTRAAPRILPGTDGRAQPGAISETCPGKLTTPAASAGGRPGNALGARLAPADQIVDPTHAWIAMACAVATLRPPAV